MRRDLSYWSASVVLVAASIGGSLEACGFGVSLDGLADGKADGSVSDGPIPDGGQPDVPVVPFVPAIQLTAGGASTCALRKDGTVLCWGARDNGRLGDGKNRDSSVPSLVNGLSDATQISAGDAHVCAVRSSGAVACWGYNYSGQLGDGTQNDADSIKSVQGLSDATMVGGGVNYTCALKKDATVACWGDNGGGQLGDGSTNKHLTPMVVPNLKDVMSIAVGGWHVCALTKTGDVWCWGQNDDGQVGTDTSGMDVHVPTQVKGLSGVTALSSGREHTCALLPTGQIKCWGNGNYGNLGNSSNSSTATPVGVFNVSDATSIGMGGLHSCAVQKSGAVSCWGANDWGQLGSGDTSITSANVPITTKISGIVEVAGGYRHTCARSTDGHVSCWGSDRDGRLGLGTCIYATTPVAVAGPKNVTAIAVGSDGFACALQADGSLYCWGNNDNGELAQNKVPATGTPLSITVSPTITPTKVVAGGTHLCEVGAGTDIVCWGYGSNGQLGDGKSNSTTGGTVFGGPGYGGDPTSLGYNHSCAMIADGGVACSGSNYSGQIGNGNNTQQDSPVLALLPDPATAAFAGGNHTCAITSKDAYCWGAGGYGEVNQGNGSTSTPVSANLPSAAKAFAMGYAHICALLQSGDVYCVGGNNGGQLGNGSTSSTSTPSKVSLPHPGKQIASGDGHSCALLDDGTVMCWGYGDNAQIGNGTAANALQPTPVSGLTGVLAIAAGGDSSCVIQGDKTVACWGHNNTGQLGDGTAMVVATPAPVAGF
jgi:alpha-tubulin suppressor-like RCC1 family protein